MIHQHMRVQPFPGRRIRMRSTTSARCANASRRTFKHKPCSRRPSSARGHHLVERRFSTFPPLSNIFRSPLSTS